MVKIATEILQYHNKEFDVLHFTKELLSTNLNARATLSTITRLVVPALADLCIIDLVKGNKSFERIAYARDANLEEIRWFFERHQPNPNAPTGVCEVLRSGKPVLNTDLNLEFLKQVSRNDHELLMFLRLRLKSRMCFPLQARDRAFGVITFFMSNSDRNYSKNDFDLGVELSYLIALALYNSWNHKKTLDSVELLEDTLSITSHELKTPLNALLLKLSFLKKTQSHIAHQELEEHIGTCERISQKMGSLIEQLLNYKNTFLHGKAELNLKVFDLVVLVNEVVSDFQYVPGISVVHNTEGHDGYYLGDRNKLSQVMTNLISNAIKYGENKPIVVRVIGFRTKLVINVIDQGIGIDPDKQALIFERFKRAVDPKSSPTGLGLGLYIAKTIVEQHEGQILVTSQPRKGSTFTVELPI